MFVVRLLCVISVCCGGFADAAEFMRPEDIVRLERPTCTAISSDGMKVAYGVKRANIQENKNTEILYLWTGNDTMVLWEVDQIRQLFWQGECLYALGDRGEGSQIIQVGSSTKAQELLSSPQRIGTFTVSRDGAHLYYSQSIFTSEKEIQKAREEGYVYRWGKDISVYIQDHQYAHREWDEIVHWDRTAAKTEIVTRFAYDQWRDDPVGDWAVVSQLALSENGKMLAIQYNRLGNPLAGECSFCSDLMVQDLEKGGSYSLSLGVSIKESPCWISNSELAFVGLAIEAGQVSSAVWMWDVAANQSTQIYTSSHWIQSLFWAQQNRKLFIHEGRSISTIAWDTKEVLAVELPSLLLHRAGTVPSFSFDPGLRRCSAVAEDPMTPPQVVLYELSTQEIRPISSLNKDIQRFALGKVEKIEVKVDENLSSNGYLIHPVGERPEKRYPLILASYGFSGQTFITDAEWHSSFPAQTLAGEGYAVLLLNSPARGQAQCLAGNPELAKTYEGWDRLAIFERAVDMLSEQGLVDSSKVGLYGWSNGAFTVEFLISHSHKFHVAALGEGGDYNPGIFLIGHPQWLKIYQNMFGGFPWEQQSLKSYLDFSPYFSVDKIQTPLLMEYSGGLLQAYEMYVPLRYLNVPAELVIYDQEEHNFVRPKSRIASMQRKVDWFNYWLLSKKNPAKPDQSARWKQMGLLAESVEKSE